MKAGPPHYIKCANSTIPFIYFLSSLEELEWAFLSLRPETPEYSSNRDDNLANLLRKVVIIYFCQINEMYKFIAVQYFSASYFSGYSIEVYTCRKAPIKSGQYDTIFKQERKVVSIHHGCFSQQKKNDFLQF